MDIVEWFFANSTCMLFLGSVLGVLAGYLYGHDRGFSEAMRQFNDRIKQFELPGL